MKILIVGSKGFIGTHLVEYLRQKPDHEVWGCDVVADYTDDKYQVIDTTNANFTDLFKTVGFDVCVNCSGAASVPDSLSNPMRDFSLNTLNVYRLLDAIRSYNEECKFINLSSAAVYGNPDELPVKEVQTLDPLSPYGHHKMLAENICRMFYEQYGIASNCLRIFSAYGAGLTKQLFWDLHIKAKNSTIVELYGTGMESRDFIYVSDLVLAIEAVMTSMKDDHTVLNAANGKEILIKDAVATFFRHYDRNVEFRFGGERRIGDPLNWVADISDLQSRGYENKVSFNEGINKYCQWLRGLE